MRAAALAIAVILAPALASGTSSVVAEREPVHGLWLTENGRAIVEFSACGETACGRTVWVADPRDESGVLKRDIKNPEPGKRVRPICGLQLVGGLRSDGTGTWDDGWIYNPRDGDTYSVKVTARSETELEVRGFVGVSLLGKSQTWTRVDDDRGGC